MSRNVVLDSWKFLLTVLVVALHSSWIFPPEYFVRGYLAVEFFFIVSGFFLARSIYFGKSTPYMWAFHKVKQIFPALALCVFVKLLITYLHKFYGSSILNFASGHFDVVYELLFLQRSGLSSYSVLGVDWYLSSMVIAGFLLFGLSYVFSKAQMIYFVLPMISLFSLSYFVNGSKHFDVHSRIIFGFFDVGTLRAVASMCIGIVMFDFLEKNTDKIKKISSGFLTSTVIELFILFIALKSLIGSGHKPQDSLVLIVFVLIVVSSFCTKGLVNLVLSMSVFKYCAKLSLMLYLSHPIVNAYGKMVLGTYWSIPVYILCSLLFAFAMECFLRVIALALHEIVHSKAITNLLSLVNGAGTIVNK